MSKVQMIVVDSGELYVFGNLVSRHPETPWLFSITDIYKACERAIKKEAFRKNLKPESYFLNKRPNQWLRTKDNYSIAKSAASTRKRLIKYGINCGFATLSDNQPCASVQIKTGSDRDMVIKIVKGGSTKGDNKKVQGTYVCQNWIVQYAAFLNESLCEEITNTFIAVLNGYTEDVTKKVEKNERIAKGTQTRTDNIQLNHRLVEACGLKRIIPMKVQQGVNEGVLGMTATKYKKLHGIKEPFNDNLTEDQVDMKNIGIALATLRIRNHAKEILTHKEGNHIGLTSGQRARKLAEESKD